MKRDRGWWDEFFPAFRPVFGKVAQKATNAQVRFIIKKMNLKKGSKFLDCPCGIGRIALPLATVGVKVTGVDITESYLTELAATLKRRGFMMDLHHGDMRRIDFDSEFDAGGNLWTSFGFFDTEADNLLVLKKMYKALKPGGKFLLHVINRDWIMANYSDNGWFPVGDTKVLEQRGFEYDRSISTGRWTIIRDGQEKVLDMAIRVYSYHELLTMFKKAGFVDIEGYGSTKEEPIAPECRMMFIFGTRPRR